MTTEERQERLTGLIGQIISTSPTHAKLRRIHRLASALEEAITDYGDTAGTLAAPKELRASLSTADFAAVNDAIDEWEMDTSSDVNGFLWSLQTFDGIIASQLFGIADADDATAGDDGEADEPAIVAHAAG